MSMETVRLRLVTIMSQDQKMGLKGSPSRIRARYHPPGSDGHSVVVHSGSLVDARFITLIAIVSQLLIGPLGLRVRDEASWSVKFV